MVADQIFLSQTPGPLLGAEEAQPQHKPSYQTSKPQREGVQQCINSRIWKSSYCGGEANSWEIKLKVEVLRVSIKFMGDLSASETSTSGEQNTPLLILTWGTKTAVCIYTPQKEETGDLQTVKCFACSLSKHNMLLFIWQLHVLNSKLIGK